MDYGGVMTVHTGKIDFEALIAPFTEEDLEWRVQSAGETNSGQVWARVLCYVTARAVMNRLDEVFGPENWQDQYTTGPAGGVLCGIGVRVNDEWVWKWDGADNTDVEAVKGGLSSALKRTAVKWGIGRYLYRLEDNFAKIHRDGRFRGSFEDRSKKRKRFRWDPPALPKWALPEGAKPQKRRAPEPDPKSKGEGAPKPRPATDEQNDRIDALIRSRVMSEENHAKVVDRAAAGLTYEKAAKAIEWLEKQPKKERAA